MERAAFCSYWNKYSEYRLAFLALSASAKTPISLVFHTALLLIKELISQQKKCSNGPVPMGFTGFILIPTHPKATSSTEQWGGLWQIQFGHQLGSSALQGWGKVLYKAVYTLN